MGQATPPNLLDTSLHYSFASNNTRLLRIRWTAGGGMLLATLVSTRVLALPLPETPLLLLGILILAYNSLIVWRTRQIEALKGPEYIRRIQRLFVLQIGLDWLSLLLFLHLTGGITSPGVPFFFLHVIVVTVILPGQSPYVYCAVAVGVIGLVELLEVTGLLSHYTVLPGIDPDLYANPVYALAQGGFFAITIFATAYLASSIMDRLRERERQIAILLQTTQDITSTLDLPDVLQRLSRNAAGALAAQAASIRLLDDSGEVLTMTAAHGLSQKYLEKGPVDLVNSEMDREALAGHPVIIRDPSRDPRIQYPQEMAAEGIQSILAVPILGQGRRLGVLRVYSASPDDFDQEDADFALAIARQGATALSNALAHDALHRADQERAQFVRIVTHELRAPVTGAQSLISLLTRNMVGELTPQQMDIVGRLERRMAALLDLIGDLLTFAAGKAVERNQPLVTLPLCQTMDLIMDRQRPQAVEKGLTLTLNCHSPEHILTVNATEEGLGRIFDNVIGNAVKYTPAGGSVTVDIRAEGGRVIVTVADTGIGIPPEALAHLGEEFYRAPNAKSAGITGTGLGMAIVKQMVTRFGGKLRVESTVGVGSTFTIALPLATPPG